MNSHLYCKTLKRVTKRELLNTVHLLTLQLKANGPRPYSESLGTHLDNTPAIYAGERIMAKAGHMGYTS